MRIENTDRFRNKICKVIFKISKGSGPITGRIIYIPNCSERYDYHEVGWFIINCTNGIEEMKLDFKDIARIEPIEKEGDKT